MRKVPQNLLKVAIGVAACGAGSFLFANQASIAEPGAPIQVAPVLMTAAVIADPRIASDPGLLADDSVTFTTPDPVISSKPVAKPAVAQLDPELECMAKVVRHEAANQSRRGQIAVAQILMNRVRSGRFADTVCDTANQPGQFFNLSAYNPSRDTPQWQVAVEVSSEVLSGESQDVARGAYFYHAASQSPNAFFRTRERVHTVGDHIFYR